MRDFQALARLSEADGHLQQRIKQLLKLSKEKWDAACDHAKTAVQVTQNSLLTPTHQHATQRHRAQCAGGLFEPWVPLPRSTGCIERNPV